MDPFIQDPALLQEFVIESEELLQGVDQDLLRLEAAPHDEELLNRVFRAVHTIKGTAGFLGLEPIVRLGHKAEDVLSRVRKQEIQINQRITGALLAARDQLGKMLADIRSGGLKQYAIEPLLNELGAVQTNETQTNPLGDAAAVQVFAPAESREPGTPPDSATSTAKPATSQPKTETTIAAQTMRVAVSRLDELVNLIGELVLERNRLLQLVKEMVARSAGAVDSPLAHAVARLSFITEELQAAGLRTRMVPIENLFCKFPRLVRDLACSLQKQAELQLYGQETRIDKTMAELIADPLVHLLRNALDHGLEAPQERERANKPRNGKIRLEARQEGDRILISISDDGAGIDPEKILRKAIEKKLISGDRAAQMNEREMLELLFLPGFSTADQATSVSGRGVGMDVVRSNIKKLNGSVEIESRPGAGTRVDLRVPLTLAILPVLLVEVGEEIYALPLREIIETSRFDSADIHEFEGQELVGLRGETLPLLRLQELFATPSNERKASSEKKIVVMSVGETRIALLVDRLLGQESTVVKPLAGLFNRCPGIAGATLGGDGLVRLVLDPAGLLLSASRPGAQELLQ